MTRARSYGWKRDLADPRDFRFTPPPVGFVPPRSAFLADVLPPAYDQAQLGSCTANAIAGLVQFVRRRERLQDFVPSRLMIYFDERVIEGTVPDDAGASLRDGLASVAKQGVCPEAFWPYIPANFTIKPPAHCYASAMSDCALAYARVAQDLTEMQHALARGNPFVVGFSVYDSFESNATAQSGRVDMPGSGEKPSGRARGAVRRVQPARTQILVPELLGSDLGAPPSPRALHHSV